MTGTITLEELKEEIKPADARSQEEAKLRWMSVAKPLFSLGKLEDAVIRMAGIKGTADFELKKKGLVIMCADNGVVAEGITQTGQEVTAAVAGNFKKKAASVAIMGELAGVDLFPVDIGMVSDVPSVTRPEYKVAYGTRNFAEEPAMTEVQVWEAIQVGIHMVSVLKGQGYDLLATGEMGIGNTATSSAVAAVLLDKSPGEVTGKGAGLTDAGLEKKIGVIEKAIRLHRPDKQDVLDVLAKVGGLDIAGLTGVFLGGAYLRIPVLVDGFISAAAALCACRLVPNVGDYLMASHVSKEPAGRMLLDALCLSPLLDCDMCLGEGSGAVAAVPLLEMGLSVYRRMSTFKETNIRQYEVLK
ncbi:nicotinate-nucleotide--dimethylbenzimidazole phosphoribosyltransferase [Luxibacter massiliensis]|uniref:nicotinate-nucleotide--dimethylbenzimidazole phosphoribosyltransferase n=1 Tax=Luxibacter massiliensis TaxID=2219695 RepID=UPI0015B12085|nr:nicotinate-nucleotide--dimethylbenzimidazole phosphoribosyltransferase [Luxibacter massiliensis]